MQQSSAQPIPPQIPIVDNPTGSFSTGDRFVGTPILHANNVTFFASGHGTSTRFMGSERVFTRAELGAAPMTIQNIAFMTGSQTGLQPLNFVNIFIQERTNYNHSFLNLGGTGLTGGVGYQFKSANHTI